MQGFWKTNINEFWIKNKRKEATFYIKKTNNTNVNVNITKT